MKLIITAWIKEQIRKHKYYTCSACGWTVLKAEAKISGFHDDRMYGRHVHCGNCGKIIATFV
jgi:transcription elongation factor Elf1